jgi:hypothetical protein
MIRSLLVCDDLPSSTYGTGQRLLSLQRALAKLGQCRILHLTNGASEPNEAADYRAPLPFDFRASRAAWARRHLTFAEARRDDSYRAVFERIRNEYPFDLVLCSFFRNASAVPTDIAPCFIDLDAIPERTGPLTRALWPLTLRAMQRRARDFRTIYVIRSSDAALFKTGATNVRVLPGISASAPATPLPHNPDARRVLFIAPAGWPPNREAVDWLLALDVPRALDSLGFELRLVGQGTEAFAPRPGLSCGGFVGDLAAEYEAARLVLCPIWTGSGANIKLAEAVQFGRAVLATAHSAAGFEGFLQPGRDLLTFDEREQFLPLLLTSLPDSNRLRELEINAVRGARHFLNQAYIDRIIAEDAAAIFGQPE